MSLAPGIEALALRGAEGEPADAGSHPEVGSLLAGAGETGSLAAKLLAAQEGGGGLAALFADHPDPTVRAVAELLARRQQEKDEEADPDAAPPAPPPESLALHRRLRASKAENRRLAEINDGLAAALGACARCWGDDPACPDCEGLGEPGAAAPDSELFHRLVLPAVRRVKESLKPKTSPPRRSVPRSSEPNPKPERRRE